MKPAVLVLATTAVLGTAGVVALGDSPPPAVTASVLGTGTLVVPSTVRVPLSRSDGFVMFQVTVPPGQSFGWHAHRTAVVVAITAGTLTLYDSYGPKCTARRYGPGQGFADPGNHLHLGRNEGTTPVSMYATYVGVPRALRVHPDRLDISNRKRPAKCPASVV